MNLFIKIENDNPVGHPALEDNLIQAFGTIPNEWESFIRVPCPDIGVYQILESDIPSYQKIDDMWTDVWLVRNMTIQEKTDKQNSVKLWAKVTNQDPSWIFDETSCRFVPPVPKPDNLQPWIWDRPSQSWIIKS
jgi:hypothetical protein